MNLRDWPIAGAAVALTIAVLFAIAAWRNMPQAIPPAAPAPAAPRAQLGFDRDRAFSDFQMRLLGLPTVHTYPQPHPAAQK